ncbi:VOC family protein [Brevibacillus humidisoli]|uniref:VOC family protein n=1 Tax=Brevibacillus humidisoli TaxID=2895522 RepID=UPI001E56F2FF|nr:VOC family protein [Brevibacillus humidisoli]UFJ43178.1 VOC family protein [Brevibacillus humidisoli]
MFQLDRLVYVTNHPEERHQQLTSRGFALAASGLSYPGVSTRTYPLAGGGVLEIAYVSDESLLPQSKGGQALAERLRTRGDGFNALMLETDELDRVKGILKREEYPVVEPPTQEITDPSGETIRFRLIGTFPHLPWFIQYEKPRLTPVGYPQATFIRTTSYTADVAILEKIFGISGMSLQSISTAASFPLRNASLRVESADEYGFAYLDPNGILFEQGQGTE